MLNFEWLHPIDLDKDRILSFEITNSTLTNAGHPPAAEAGTARGPSP
jgi:hypothetical protein